MKFGCDENGNLIFDFDKWFCGMKVVVDDIYVFGFKFGLYGCVGKFICVSYLGFEGYE